MRRRTVFLSVLGAVLLTVGGMAVYATIPDSSGVIHGCYDAKGGALRVVDPPTPPGCTAKERAVNWNQTGPAGPQGAQGPAGSAGPQGPAGGVSGYEMITATAIGAGAGATAICPPGKAAIGGGAEASQLLDALSSSRPVQYNYGGTTPPFANAWFGRLSGSVVSGNDAVNVYVICAFVQT